MSKKHAAASDAADDLPGGVAVAEAATDVSPDEPAPASEAADEQVVVDDRPPPESIDLRLLADCALGNGTKKKGTRLGRVTAIAPATIAQLLQELPGGLVAETKSDGTVQLSASGVALATVQLQPNVIVTEVINGLHGIGKIC